MNRGITLAKWQYFSQIDSDDYVVPDYAKNIRERTNTIKNENDIYAVSGARVTSDGKPLKGKWPLIPDIPNYIDATDLEHSQYDIDADMCKAWRTEVRHRYPFPAWDSEKFARICIEIQILGEVYMRVLYVVGSCLSKNTSANMSHNGYIQGLLKSGCQLDILMAKDSWGQNDSLLPTWMDAKYYSYPSTAIHDRIRKFFSSATAKTTQMTPTNRNTVSYRGEKSASIKSIIRGYLKNGYYRIFPADPKYPLEAYWLKKASKFYSDVEYDLVISNSSPAASHKLVDILTRNGHLKYKRWAQIWEDPWYYDLYGGHAKEVFDEERALLDAASEVFYVSPLTLAYQKQYFAENAYKMKQIPLPYFSISKSIPNSQSEMSLAYLGDYYSYVRNLTPFYMALRQTGLKGYIYGDTDISFESTDHIKISGRVTLSTLAVVQDKAGILVQLCNLHGGQIPGKIYHYSATRKPILFILDGTAKERRQIRSYFSRYNRYYFCENYVDSIVSTIKIIESDIKDGKVWKPVDAFSPATVISQLL